MYRMSSNIKVPLSFLLFLLLLLLLLSIPPSLPLSLQVEMAEKYSQMGGSGGVHVLWLATSTANHYRHPVITILAATQDLVMA